MGNESCNMCDGDDSVARLRLKEEVKVGSREGLPATPDKANDNIREADRLVLNDGFGSK